MAITIKDGLNQINAQIELESNGVAVDPAIFAELDYKNTYLQQIHSCMDYNLGDVSKFTLPSGFRIKSSGFYVGIFWNPTSKIKIVKENGKFFLVKNDGKDFSYEIEFERKPQFYNKVTKDGKDMSRIVQANSRGRLSVIYSNECSLKEKGWDCLFCNINATKNRFGEQEHLEWKSVTEIAEVVAEAYREGYHGFNLTGGFIPERREVDYYIDVIDAIKDAVDIPEDEIHGMACIGAPQDEGVVEKYKESGYQHIATNLEVWNPDVFTYICPGKEKMCGGRDNWLKVLKHEVSVFGRGFVRSNLVAGLETKTSLLEGIETLSELGVIANATIWKPNIGSALEGHRPPEAEWYQDLIAKEYQIHKKNGFTFEQYYYVYGENSPCAHYYQLYGEHLPWNEKLEVKN